jgi:hypothetical protein
MQIEQVAAGVAQMNQVTQANAANAEESASASEELNAQVEQVNSMIQELIAIAGKSSEARNDGGGRASRRARHVVGKLAMRDDLFPHELKEGPGQVIAQPHIQRQGRSKRVAEGKRSAQKNPEQVIPFREGEGKEKDEEVLRHF